MKRFCAIAGAAVCVSFAAFGITPGEIEFKRVWQGRWVFDAELPFPKGVTFLPLAHYRARIDSRPAEMCLVDANGNELMSFAAPENVAVPFVMHLGLGGRSHAAVFVTKDGKTELSRLVKFPAGFDPRQKAFLNTLSLRLSAGGKSKPVRAAISAGIGQADVRFVTRGRCGEPYLKDGRLFFTFSTRCWGSGCGIGSLDPRRPEAGVRFEGIILFDYGDGLLRNDLAPHIFYDETANAWRGWACNFSTSADEGAKGRAPGGINAVWAKELPLQGVNVMNAKPLGLPGMNEDPCGVWDREAGKWRLLLSAFTPKGIKAQMYESDRWDGGFTAMTGTVAEDSTGTTIVTCDGRRYCLSGSVDRKYYLYSYPRLERAGSLRMSPPPWAEGAKGWPHGRGWPSFIELPAGCGPRYLMLTMDRENFPGMPNPNWTYGALHLYVGD
jgi:hypothetical protein